MFTGVKPATRTFAHTQSISLFIVFDEDAHVNFVETSGWSIREDAGSGL
jgi:hypothetical protein